MTTEQDMQTIASIQEHIQYANKKIIKLNKKITLYKLSIKQLNQELAKFKFNSETNESLKDQKPTKTKGN